MICKTTRALLGGALLALPAAGQDAATAATATTPPVVEVGAVEAGTIVDVDPKAGLFTDPLPFDVPFWLRGPRGAASNQRVSAKVLRFHDPVNCVEHEALFALTAGADPVHTLPDDGRRLKKRQVYLTDLGRAAATVENGQAKFLLLVPPLPVYRSYCFQFLLERDVTEPQRTAFLGDAFAAVDAGLRDVAADDTTRKQVYKDLRDDLIGRVEALLGEGEVLRFKAGTKSFFDGTVALEQVDLKAHERFTQILSRDDSRGSALTAFRDQQAVAFTRLKELTASAEYRAVVQAIEEHRGSNAALDTLASQPGALEVAGLDDAGLDKVALGVEPGAAGTNLDQVFAPALLGPRFGRLQASVAGLRAFGTVVARLGDSQPLRAAAGLDDDAGKAALAALAAPGSPLRRAADSVEVTRRRLVRLQEALTAREQEIRAFLADLEVEFRELLSVAGTTLAGFQIRAMWYISADVGLGVAGEIDEVFPYVGTNVYFRPVNKKARLGPLFGPQQDFWKRFALVVGLPYDQLEEPGRLLPVIQKRPLVLGAGLRLNDLLRVTAGGLVFEKEDPDPLVTRGEGLTATWFVSVSIDWDLRSTFKPMFQSLGLGTAGID